MAKSWRWRRGMSSRLTGLSRSGGAMSLVTQNRSSCVNHPRRNLGPDFRVLRIKRQPFLKARVRVRLYGIHRTFWHANTAVYAFVWVDHEHILALVEAIHGAHLDTVHGFAANAAFIDDVGQLSVLLGCHVDHHDRLFPKHINSRMVMTPVRAQFHYLGIWFCPPTACWLLVTPETSARLADSSRQDYINSQGTWRGLCRLLAQSQDRQGIRRHCVSTLAAWPRRRGD